MSVEGTIGNVRIAEVIACLIFIFMEGLNSLSNLSESRRCPAGRDSQEMPPDHQRTPGPLQFCRITIVREFRLLLLEACLLVLLVSRSNSSIFVSLNSSNVFLCSKLCRFCIRDIAVHLHKKLFQYTQYFTTLTDVLREILAGSLELWER